MYLTCCDSPGNILGQYSLSDSGLKECKTDLVGYFACESLVTCPNKFVPW